jgi:hypothetical protein
MVEVHYEEERGNERTGQIEKVHWRIVVNDEAAAVAQIAQDIADGRQPLAVVNHPASDPWDYRLPYDRSKWTTLLSGQQMRRRANDVGPAF